MLVYPTSLGASLNVPDQSGGAPHIGIVSLIPIDKALPSSNSWDCGPAAAQADVVLAVEEVGCVARVEAHWLEAWEGRERSACPFPKAAYLALTARLGQVSHRCGMPVPEANIATGEVDEYGILIEFVISVSIRNSGCSARFGYVRRTVGWRRFLDAFVAEMAT